MATRSQTGQLSQRAGTAEGSIEAGLSQQKKSPPFGKAMAKEFLLDPSFRNLNQGTDPRPLASGGYWHTDAPSIR